MADDKEKGNPDDRVPLDSLSDDELEMLMGNPEALEKLNSEETSSDVEAKVESTGSEQETAPEPKDDKPPAESAPSVDPMAEFKSSLEDLRLQLEEEKVLRQKAEARTERERFLASRAAGEAGYLKRLMREGKMPKAKPQEPEYEDDEPTTAPMALPDDIEDMRVGLRALQKNEALRTMKDEVDALASKHSDLLELMPQMATAIQGYAQDESVQSALEGGDPKLVRIVTRSLIEQAYADAKLAKIEAMRNEIKAKKIEQVARLDEAKKKASISASGAPSVGPPKQKTLDELSDKELDALMREVSKPYRR